MKAWSRGRTLAIGLGLIVLTNAVALGGVWWNRAAAPESTLTLSERELGLPWRALRNRENSGLALNLNWRVADREAGEFVSGYTVNGGTPEWLDGARMQALGFTLDDIASDSGRRRYTRQSPRQAVFVLELDGPAAQRALDQARENAARHAAAARHHVLASACVRPRACVAYLCRMSFLTDTTPRTARVTATALSMSACEFTKPLS